LVGDTGFEPVTPAV